MHQRVNHRQAGNERITLALSVDGMAEILILQRQAGRGERGILLILARSTAAEIAVGADAFRERSIAARATWLGTLAGESREVPKELGSVEREPVELDPETRAALTVWGDLPP